MIFRSKLLILAVIAAVFTAPTCAYAEVSGNASRLRIPVIRDGDVDMTCEQLWKEAFLMRSIIAQTRTTQHDSKMTGRGIGVVGTAASYLVGTVTGGLSIAAAGLVAGAVNSDKSEDAELIQETAQQRRAMIAGIFAAKKCQGPIEEAFSEPRIAPENNTANIANISPAAGDPERLAKPRYNQ